MLSTPVSATDALVISITCGISSVAPRAETRFPSVFLAYRLSTCKQRIAFLAPSWSPRVFDLPIGLSAQGAVANHQNSVVKFGSACCVGQHTRPVQLEDPLVSFNCDRHWPFANSLHQGLRAVSLHGSV